LGLLGGNCAHTKFRLRGNASASATINGISKAASNLNIRIRRQTPAVEPLFVEEGRSHWL
jgi:hypothetical protein